VIFKERFKSEVFQGKCFKKREGEKGFENFSGVFLGGNLETQKLGESMLFLL
jgi:hypothetical protein